MISSLLFFPRKQIHRVGVEVGGAPGGPRGRGARPWGEGAPPPSWTGCVKEICPRGNNKVLYISYIISVEFQVIPTIFISLRMATSASLCEGPIFYYYPLPYAGVMVIFTFPFYILSFGKHIVLERSRYIYIQIGCKLS